MNYFSYDGEHDTWYSKINEKKNQQILECFNNLQIF